MTDLKLAANNSTASIIDGSSANFMRDVIEPSQRQLVLVDFWAPWCGPCKQLTPILEKIVREKSGKVRLVKIDIDQNKALASQLQIQSVPMVYAFLGGQPVDAFMGVLPEAQLRAFIDRLLGAEDGANPIEAAKQELAAGNIAGAAMLYQEILAQQPDSVPALTGLAQCYLKSGDAARAKETAEKIAQKDRGQADISALFAALELAQLAPAGDTAELEKKIAANPKDQQARLDLANALAGSDMERAIEILLQSVKFDRKWNEEAARQQLLKFFTALGFDHPLSVAGRKKLSSILFA